MQEAFVLLAPFIKGGFIINVVQDFSPAYTADLKVCTTEMH